MHLYRWMTVVVACLGTGLLGQFYDRPGGETVFSGPINVRPGDVHVVPVRVEIGEAPAVLSGEIFARGGFGNDIRIVVASGPASGAKLLFNSGQVQRTNLGVTLAEAGEYNLILDNRFSAISQKSVQGWVVLRKSHGAKATALQPSSGETAVERETQVSYDRSPLPVNSKLYVPDFDGFGSAFVEAIEREGLPLVQVRNREKARAELITEQAAQGSSFRLVDLLEDTIVLTCRVKELETEKDVRKAAAQCAADLKRRMTQ